MVYKRLGEILLANEAITEGQLRDALEYQRKHPGQKLGEILIEHTGISRRQVYKALERQLGVESIELTGMIIPKDIAQLVPRSLATKHHVVPIQVNGDNLSLAMSDPLNFVATDAVAMATKKKIIPLLAAEEEVTRAIADLYGSETAEQALSELQDSEESDTPDF